MNLIESTQFYIKEVSINSKGGDPFQITNLIEEISLYDNLFMPVLSGHILITDTSRIIDRITLIDDVIQIHITKMVDEEFASFKKSFRIYSITDRKNINNTSEAYIIHFVAEELKQSDRQKVSKSYNSTYSEVVENILKQNLNVDRNNIAIVEKSLGIRRINVNNLRPLDALEWCAKRALDSKNSPDFLFFANRAGYNFVSLSKLLTQNSILNINFSPKNLDNEDQFFELSKARSFEVVSQFDAISKLRSGADAGTFIGFDPITRTIGAKTISGDQTYSNMEHGNKKQITNTVVNPDGTSNKTDFNAKQTLSINSERRKISDYIKKNDPTSISKDEKQEMFLHQRQTILTNLMQKRLKIVMPGNFQLSSGFNVTIDASGFSARTKGEDVNMDKSLSGKYIITGTRHIIGLRSHVTVIEVATDSTNDSRNLVSSPNQRGSLKQYGEQKKAA
jgi:hypothetical protein